MIRFIVVSISLLFAVGCSLDHAQILEHPSEARPNDTIHVKLSNTYLYLNSSSTIFFPVTRDSFHVAVGLPEGFKLLSIDYYNAKHFRMAKYLNTFEDSLDMTTALQDSLQLFESRKIPMTPDPNFKNAFKNLTVSAHSSADGSTNKTINTDSIAHWYTYSNHAAISVSGKTDTIIYTRDLDTSSLASIGTDTIPVDSIGITALPIFVFARIVAPAIEGNYTLYYYTKTAKFTGTEPDTSGTLNPAALDVGSMAYVDVKIDNSISVKNIAAAKTSSATLIAKPSFFTQGVEFSLPRGAEKRSVSIYSLEGIKVRELQNDGNRSIPWDGNASDGKRVPIGTYMAKLEGTAGAACVIRKVR